MFERLQHTQAQHPGVIRGPQDILRPLDSICSPCSWEHNLGALVNRSRELVDQIVSHQSCPFGLCNICHNTHCVVDFTGSDQSILQ